MVTVSLEIALNDYRKKSNDFYKLPELLKAWGEATKVVGTIIPEEFQCLKPILWCLEGIFLHALNQPGGLKLRFLHEDDFVDNDGTLLYGSLTVEAVTELELHMTAYDFLGEDTWEEFLEDFDAFEFWPEDLHYERLVITAIYRCMFDYTKSMKPTSEEKLGLCHHLHRLFIQSSALLTQGGPIDYSHLPKPHVSSWALLKPVSWYVKNILL